MRIQVEGDPRGVGICNWLACQQRTGSVFAALAGTRVLSRIGMRSLVATAILILVSSCATEGGYKSTLLRWENLHNQPGFEAYVSAFIGAQSAAHLDSNSGCYNFNVGTTVDLLLVVESSGRIGAAYSDAESKKAKCFRKAYVGAKMPIPPFSPFPMRMRVR
jgi:hypothetical protein